MAKASIFRLYYTMIPQNIVRYYPEPMMRFQFILFLVSILFLPGSQQITDVTAFSPFTLLPSCVQDVMTNTVVGLLENVCSPWACVCANQEDATSEASYLISIDCNDATNDISKGVSFITAFCDQFGTAVPQGMLSRYDV